MAKQTEADSTNISNHSINSLLLCISHDINNKATEEPDRMVRRVFLTLHQIAYYTKLNIKELECSYLGNNCIGEKK